MGDTRFTLSARVSSDRPEAVGPVLEGLLPQGSVTREGGEFVVKAGLRGADAKGLNRSLLTALRKAEKKTRLRAEWTSADGTTYRFFDYVLKKTTRTKPSPCRPDLSPRRPRRGPATLPEKPKKGAGVPSSGGTPMSA